MIPRLAATFLLTLLAALTPFEAAGVSAPTSAAALLVPRDSAVPGNVGGGGNSTEEPTIAPGNSTDGGGGNSTTVAPTSAPDDGGSNHTTAAPTPGGNSTPTEPPVPVPTPAPTTKPAPTEAPGKNETNHTATDAPTAAPTDGDDGDGKKGRHHPSLLRILGKTVGWLIVIGLSVVAFGALMSHRYRIYFFLRGVWYALLRTRCVRYVLQKLGRGGGGGLGGIDPSLNTIVFDDDMAEGLLMRESNE